MNDAVEQNGVVRPLRNTMAGEAWAIFDQLGRSFAVKKALEIAMQRGLNLNNVRTELCRWRKFHSIKMR